MASERQRQLDAQIDAAKAEGLAKVAQAAAAEERGQLRFMATQSVSQECAREICHLMNQTEPGSKHYDAGLRADGHPNVNIVARNLEWHAPDLNREWRSTEKYPGIKPLMPPEGERQPTATMDWLIKATKLL